MANRETLVPRLAELTQQRSRDELLAACSAAGVPATPVLTLPEALADPQAEARGAVINGSHPTIGAVPMIASPLWHVYAAGEEAPFRQSDVRAAPLLGQHGRSVLTNQLGLSAAEVDELVSRILGAPGGVEAYSQFGAIGPVVRVYSQIIDAPVWITEIVRRRQTT